MIFCIHFRTWDGQCAFFRQHNFIRNVLVNHKSSCVYFTEKKNIYIINNKVKYKMGSYTSVWKDDLRSKKYIWQWPWTLNYLYRDPIFGIKINIKIICIYRLSLIRRYVFDISTLILTCSYAILYHSSKCVVDGKNDRLKLNEKYLNIHV